jgi:predicted nucleic acid-binding protein
MTAMVVDASSIVDLVRADRRAERTRERVRGARLHAPDLVTLEVVSALSRQQRDGIPESSVSAAVELFLRLPLVQHASADLVTDAWSLRKNLRIADAFYVALAREIGAALVTSDARLGRAVRQRELCDVHVIE